MATKKKSDKKAPTKEKTITGLFSGIWLEQKLSEKLILLVSTYKNDGAEKAKNEEQKKLLLMC